MATPVRFRFNKLIGESEESVVDDGGQPLPETRKSAALAGIAACRFVVAPGPVPFGQLLAWSCSN